MFIHNRKITYAMCIIIWCLCPIEILKADNENAYIFFKKLKRNISAFQYYPPFHNYIIIQETAPLFPSVLSYNTYLPCVQFPLPQPGQAGRSQDTGFRCLKSRRQNTSSPVCRGWGNPMVSGWCETDTGTWANKHPHRSALQERVLGAR